MAGITIPRMDVRCMAPPFQRFAPDALDPVVGRRFRMDIDLTSQGVSIQPRAAEVEVVAVQVDEDGKGATLTIEEARD